MLIVWMNENQLHKNTQLHNLSLVSNIHCENTSECQLDLFMIWHICVNKCSLLIN